MLPRGTVLDAAIPENEYFIGKSDTVKPEIACLNGDGSDAIAKSTFITEVSFQSTVYTYPVNPGDYGVYLIIIIAAFGEFLKKIFKFREFILVKMNTIEIHRVMFLNQFYGIALGHT